MPKIKLKLKGRPGWHIECSAMSAKHLTNAFENSTFHPAKFETIDLHSGGVDNMFPHHEAEIAQTEALTKKKFSNFWLHSEHLLVDNKKMSKSLGNFFTLRDLIDKGYSPFAVRYLLISTHYRHKLNFTFESLDAATKAVQRINDFMVRLTEIKDKGKANPELKQNLAVYLKSFEDALDDDLETSQALAALFDMMNEVNKLIESNELAKADAKNVIVILNKMNSVLGILTHEHELAAELKHLLAERLEARNNKDWKRSDELRDILKKKGIVVEDTEHGQRWKRLLS